MNNIFGLMTKSGFARRRGVRADHVKGWIEQGILTGEALTADGMVRVAEAERQLGNLMSFHGGEAAPSSSASRIDDSPAARRARAIAEIAELDRDRRRRLAQAEAGEYVSAAQVRANRGRALAQMLAAIDNWLPEVAGELALSRDQLVTMRASWRRFRTRQAEGAIARTAGLPELLAEIPIMETDAAA